MNLEDTDIKPYPVLLQFSATWCGPCRAMEPIVTDIRTKHATDMAHQKVDIEEHPDMAKAYNVRSIPTFVLMAPVATGGFIEVDRVVGARPAAAMEKFVDQALAKAIGVSAPAPSTEAI